MAAKRIVAPDTPVRSFPTPNIDDLVVVVDVDSRLPGYKPLDYGTLHPDQTRFPGAKLVYQEPLDGTDSFVRRIYATDRFNQEAYNYAIKYSGGSDRHPIYIRTYLEPRDTYQAMPDHSPDPLFTGAILVDEEANPAEGELRSLYLQVTRVFETLPGPVIESREVNEYGVIETLASQTVLPETEPDPTGLFVTDSIISEDVSKAVRQRRTMEKLPEPYNTYETVEKNIVVLVKRELLTRHQPLPAPVFTTATMDVQDQPLRFPYVLRTTKTLPLNPATGQPVLPLSRTEYDTITYTFPGVIYSWRVFLSSDSDGSPSVTADLSHYENRFPLTMVVAAKFVTTFHLEGDPLLDLSSTNFWKVTTRPWAQLVFGLPDNTIHPPAPVTLRSAPVLRNNVRYTTSSGLGSEPGFYEPGQELLISGEVKPWFGNVWYRRMTYVKEPIETEL
jgi:hypothetical protein